MAVFCGICGKRNEMGNTMKQSIRLFQDLTSFLRLFYTTVPFILYPKRRISLANVDIFVHKIYNNREMKPFSMYEMFQILKQR